MPNDLFYWDRPVPADWQAAVTALAPRTDRASHLVLWWEPGAPEEPTQRWVLYEATPIALVAPWKVRAFHADPVCRCAKESARITLCPACHGKQSAGRQRIRDYLLATECLALPFWIIQGDRGGHRVKYSQLEQQWQALVGQPTEPPEPGSLPYAPFDARVVRKIRALDRTRLAFRHLGQAFEQEQQDAHRAFRQALMDYADQAVEAAFDALPVTRQSALVDALPRLHTADRLSVDLDQQRDTFLAGAS